MAEQFYALITDIGLAKITNGLINNTKVDIVHMAVGDGGGSYYNPSTSQTGLVREMWRGPVGLVAIDEDNNNRIQIVSPIPPQQGGFFVREVGLFDADGDLIVIAKHPETYKPVADNGSTKDLTIKLLINVANASSIVMKLDPTVITATREYVDNKVAPISTKLIQVEEDFATHKDKIKKIKFGEMQEPFYIAHRGGMNVFPENTIEAYKGCLDLGFTMIEQDVHKLLDGSLAVIHDYTMERSTDATGCVRDFTTMRFKNSKVDTLPGWTAKSTTFKDVLNTFGNNAIYVPEIKVPDVAEDVVDAIIFAGLEEYCLIQSFRLSDLSYAVSKGLPALLLTNDESPITIKNNGIDYVGVSTQVTEQYILDCINAGLKVIVYSVNRRYLHDYFLDLGVSGFFTDDPLWITRKSPILNKDTFREQMFTHGQLGLSRHDLRPNVGNSGDRGEFISPNKFGWTNYTTGGIDDKNDFCLMGWTGELPENFTLNYNLTLKNSSGTPTTWGAVTFCTTIDIYRDINDVDNPDTPSYGYNLLLRENGNLQLYKRTASGAVVLGSVQTTALTNNSTARIKVQVQGDNITCTRVDTNQSFTVEDDEFRKGYLHVGRRASAVLFSDMSIT